jgi:hypothetical protein
MLCYVMLCYVMLCYVMLCYVMLCYVMLCYVMCSLLHITQAQSVLIKYNISTICTYKVLLLNVIIVADCERRGYE